jgi:hypothetical protein
MDPRLNRFIRRILMVSIFPVTKWQCEVKNLIFPNELCRPFEECVGITTRLSHVLFHITDARCTEVAPYAIRCMPFHD